MRQTLIGPIKSGKWRRLASRCLSPVGVLVLALLVALALVVWLSLREPQSSVRLVVYAFSTQEEVLSQRIFPGFEQAWEAETGRDLTLEGIFGPSGTLAGQINLGAPADIAIFSNAQHVDWLKFGRRVRLETKPVVIGCTPMVIVTRPDNPAGITSYADLGQSRPSSQSHQLLSLAVVHPDPASSGAGEWAILAEYGSAYLDTQDLATAEAQLQAIWRNVRLLGSSARAAMTLFELGAGDALVTYEQDARLALERGVPLEIILPLRTILAEHVAVVVDDNVTRAERPVAQAFVDYLTGAAGQQAYQSYHLRPADLGDDLVLAAAQPFRVEDLGGWSKAYVQLVEALWQTEIEPNLDLEPVPRLKSTEGD
jgi:ABC-type sulfate transport system substrate-binding protein